MGPSVHEVSHENIVGIGRLSTHFKKLEQVGKLTVNISTHSDRALHMHHITLFR